jgi:hypothetical protein
MFTQVRHVTLCYAKQGQSIPGHSIPLGSELILLCHLSLDLLSDRFVSDLYTETLNKLADLPTLHYFTIISSIFILASLWKDGRTVTQ